MRQCLICALLLLALAGCNLGAAQPTPVPTPNLPQVEFLAPQNNARVFEGTDFTIDLVARDGGGGVARIELYIDGELINTARPEAAFSVPVFRAEMNWLARGDGLHVLSAVAYRADGTPSLETALNIEVIPR